MATTTIPPAPPTRPQYDKKTYMALRNFAMSMSIFNILGYAILGFEQPWVWPFFALATGYTTEIVLEVVGSRFEGRRPRFLGGGARGVFVFLLPAHITSLAVNMLTYVNDRVLVMIFGVIVAVAAKWILRAPVRGRMRHFMNPSNLGIAVILVLFPWASIAPPYHFTERTSGFFDWLIPWVIIIGGTMINGKLTGRMTLIMGWVGVFALQAVVRGLIVDTSIVAGLGMMTGTAFILFTNYMITDPGTSPSNQWAQFAFGGGVAAVYGLLMGFNIPYGIFFATAIVCGIRGGYLWALHFSNKAREKWEAQQRATLTVLPGTGGTDGGREAIAA
jgi:enediyne biosynthesis protein E5